MNKNKKVLSNWATKISITSKSNSAMEIKFTSAPRYFNTLIIFNQSMANIISSYQGSTQQLKQHPHRDRMCSKWGTYWVKVIKQNEYHIFKSQSFLILIYVKVPDVTNSQLRDLLEKQGTEHKQAKQLIPSLQRQITSLTGQLQYLAEDLAEVAFVFLF